MPLFSVLLLEHALWSHWQELEIQRRAAWTQRMKDDSIRRMFSWPDFFGASLISADYVFFDEDEKEKNGPKSPMQLLYEDPNATGVTTSESERINGFHLFNQLPSFNLFDWDLFLKWCALEDRPSRPKWSKKAWCGAMRDTCCSDWRKQDPNGECFEGPWSQPEGSFAQENAYDLCMHIAIWAMWRLPFSKDLLLESIHIGCNNRRESVRYSNFLCVWFQRKRMAMRKAVKAAFTPRLLECTPLLPDLVNIVVDYSHLNPFPEDVDESLAEAPYESLH